MSLPTLKNLGLEDKRKRIPDEIKKAIKEELENGETNMAFLSRKYNVSIFTVRMIRNPTHEKELIKQSRRKRGGYYAKDKQRQWNKNISARKEARINELLDFYNNHKGEHYEQITSKTGWL